MIANKDILFADKDILLEEAIELLTNYSAYELEEMGIDPWDLGSWVEKENSLEEWDDRNADNPNNPYLYGIVWDGQRIATGYTGIAGCYWRENWNGNGPFWLKY